MATGRTLPKHTRVYADGYDLSGFGRTIGPLELTYDEVDLTAHMSDTVKGYLRGQPHVNVGTFNGVFDNTATTGVHALMASAGGARVVTAAIGIQGAPAAGDPCFGGVFTHKAYTPVDDGGALTVTIPFTGWAANAASLAYGVGHGQLLHANSAETAVNTGTGFDNLAGATSTLGGYLVYHVLASSNAAHTATIKVQDAATNLNASFADLTGATSGVITVTAGVSGIIAIGNAASVRRYLRWQIVLGTATSVTFVLSFHRS